MKEIVSVAVLLAAIIGVIVGIGLAVQYSANDHQCVTIHELTGAQTNVSVSAGCLVKIDGKWMTGDASLSNYKQVEIK